MKFMGKMAMVLATAILINGANSSAEAETINVKGTASGTFVSTSIDANGDGGFASRGIGGQKDTLGSATYQNLIELAPS